MCQIRCGRTDLQRPRRAGDAFVDFADSPSEERGRTAGYFGGPATFRVAFIFTAKMVGLICKSPRTPAARRSIALPGPKGIVAVGIERIEVLEAQASRLEPSSRMLSTGSISNAATPEVGAGAAPGPRFHILSGLPAGASTVDSPLAWLRMGQVDPYSCHRSLEFDVQRSAHG